MSDVIHNEGKHRFEITIDGHTGFVQYARAANRIDFLHTEVAKELGGRGLGGQLAKAALEYARDAHLQVVASCPYIKTYIERHPEYEPLLHK